MGETAEQLVGGDQLELEKESSDLKDSILLQLGMLALALLLGYCIKHYKVPYLSEAGGALLLGVLAGCIVEFSEVCTRLFAYPPSDERKPNLEAPDPARFPGSCCGVGCSCSTSVSRSDALLNSNGPTRYVSGFVRPSSEFQGFEFLRDCFNDFCFDGKSE